MAKFPNGTRVKVTGCRAGHGVPMGTVAKVSSSTHANPQINSTYRLEGYTNCNIYEDDLSNLAITKDELTKKSDELEKELALTKEMISYALTEHLTEIDDRTFRVWKALQIIETEEDRGKKAKAIAELFQ